MFLLNISRSWVATENCTIPFRSLTSCLARSALCSLTWLRSTSVKNRLGAFSPWTRAESRCRKLAVEQPVEPRVSSRTSVICSRNRIATIRPFKMGFKLWRSILSLYIQVWHWGVTPLHCQSTHMTLSCRRHCCASQSTKPSPDKLSFVTFSIQVLFKVITIHAFKIVSLFITFYLQGYLRLSTAPGNTPES